MSRGWASDLPPEEVIDEVEAGIRGEGGPETWAVLERMAATEPDLFADLIRVIEARREEEADKPRRRARSAIGALRTREGALVCAHCEVARSPSKRMKGLLGRRSLAADEGLLLRPAGSIHTAFMHFPIDAVFCDRQLRVLKVARGLRPWRLAGARKARVVVELAAGAAAELEPGDELSLELRPAA